MEKIWKEAIPPMRLNFGEAHVWLTSSDFAPVHMEYLTHVLTEKERENAGRFHFEIDRRRYIIAHFFLRSLLGAYTNNLPEQLVFSAGPYGKPYLLQHADNHTRENFKLFFNLSHSHDMIILALTLEGEIGADIEYMRPIGDIDSIAQQFFSPEEYTNLVSLPEEQKIAAFYTCWSRKEAVIKASGLGLAMPLDSFSVSLQANTSRQTVCVFTDGAPQSRWNVYSLPPVQDYAVALALRNNISTISCFVWKSIY